MTFDLDGQDVRLLHLHAASVAGWQELEDRLRLAVARHTISAELADWLRNLFLELALDEDGAVTGRVTPPDAGDVEA